MRKLRITALLLSVCAAAGLGFAFPAAAEVSGDIDLDGKTGTSDLILMQKHILNLSPLGEAQLERADLNGDGKVNVFDAVLLRRSLIGSAEEGELTDVMCTTDSTSVKFTGRTVYSDDTAWLLQSGSAVEFTVSGQSAEAVIRAAGSISGDKDHRPRYGIFVDDELVADKTLDAKEDKVEIFKGDSSSVRTVRIIMLSEAMYGAVGVGGINVRSASSEPVKPLPKKSISIEFIGDSITCAYGVEGKDQYEQFKTTTENFTKSYAYLTAKKLGADYSAVSYSGHGIVSGYSSDGKKNSDSLVPDVYELASKFKGFDSKWDFKSRSHNVVVINLGTNDINYVDAEPETHGPEFVDGYINFLKMVRKNNPTAHIICTVGTMGNGVTGMYELIEEAAETYGYETNDFNVLCYKSAQQGMESLGSDWHPSAATQQDSAYVLADKICMELGIESDQLGLDVAADADYDVEVNEESGAMESHFVGYDKSFWINMVLGGKTPEDVKACLSGICLKKGGEYRLEFSHTSSVDKEVKVYLEGKGGEYYADTVTMGASKEKFETTFAVSADDSDARLVFDIGGKDNLSLTLSDIKMTKIK